MANFADAKPATSPMHLAVDHVKLASDTHYLPGSLKLPANEVSKDLNRIVRVPLPSNDPDDPLVRVLL